MVPRSPSDSDPRDPIFLGPHLPNQALTDTGLALLKALVVSGQDPSDSATSRTLWELREDSPGLEQLHDPHSMGRARVTAANGDPRQGPSFNPRPITGKAENGSELIASQWVVTAEGGYMDLYSGQG